MGLPSCAAVHQRRTNSYRMTSHDFLFHANLANLTKLAASQKARSLSAMPSASYRRHTRVYDACFCEIREICVRQLFREASNHDLDL